MGCRFDSRSKCIEDPKGTNKCESSSEQLHFKTEGTYTYMYSVQFIVSTKCGQIKKMIVEEKNRI